MVRAFVILDLIPPDDSGFGESTRVRTHPFAARMLKALNWILGQHDVVLTNTEFLRRQGPHHRYHQELG